jgi:hypothetical protein
MCTTHDLGNLAPGSLTLRSIRIFSLNYMIEIELLKEFFHALNIFWRLWDVFVLRLGLANFTVV